MNNSYEYPYRNLSFENMEGEVWRDVVGHEGKYQVSNYGRIKSLARKSEDATSARYKKWSRDICCRIMKQQVIQKYLCVCLYKDKIKKLHKVHRLVAMAFVDNPAQLATVNHLDEDKFNNSATNLEWCTREYNDNYGTRNARISCTQRNAPSKSKRVARCDLNGNILEVFGSICEAGRNGYDRRTVSQCCRNIPHHITSNGYKWKFI